MVDEKAAKPPHIGEALASTRAAIEVVASGAATRVTVQAIDAEQILPAARALARAAGVSIEPIWWPDDAGVDLVITAGPQATDE